MIETVDLGDRKVTLVGTAHVSEESRDEVVRIIEDVGPDLVGVELDQKRFESLRDRSGWKEMDIGQAIREGKGSLLLLNTLMSIYQWRIGLEQGIEPGEEMMAAVREAEDSDIEYRLLDRDIQETFSRLRSELSLWQKYRLLVFFLLKNEEIDVEEVKKRNVLEELLEMLEQDFPGVKKVFLDERNRYIAERILEREFDHAVVVVGAAHVSGLKKELQTGISEPRVEEKGFSLPFLKIAKYGLPLFIVVGIGYSFYQLGFSTGVNATSFWILSNGILASIGALAAGSHPLTWIVSFLAAPLTSLDPALGAGMVAAYFEAKFYPPSVGELEEIAYLDSYKDLWKNQAGRILLTFLLVTVGSALATFISAGYILSLL